MLNTAQKIVHAWIEAKLLTARTPRPSVNPSWVVRRHPTQPELLHRTPSRKKQARTRRVPHFRAIFVDHNKYNADGSLRL